MLAQLKWLYTVSIIYFLFFSFMVIQYITQLDERAELQNDDKEIKYVCEMFKGFFNF